jgi:hypothetical protein
LTCFTAHKNQTIDDHVLKTWRSETLDRDDVFHPDFLKEVVFSGVGKSDVVITADAQTAFSDWKTSKISFLSTHLLSDGPYYIDRGVLYTVWRVYEDRQLAFMQSLWASLKQSR